MGFIYRITNNVNGKAYIGKTAESNPYIRINHHFRGHSHQCRAIHNAIKKYGRDAFTTDLLAAVPDHMLCEVEMHCIEQFGTLTPGGYNLTEGGESGQRSDETRRKISGKGNPNYGNRGPKNPLFGKPRSDDFKRKLSKAKSGENHHFYGIPRTPEAKEKTSKSLRKFHDRKKYGTHENQLTIFDDDS